MPSNGVFSHAFMEAMDAYDPGRHKLHRIMRDMEDPNNPNRPEFNHNPLQIEPDSVIVLATVQDHGIRFAHRVLSVQRVWDHRLILGLGGTDSILRVLSFHLIVEENGYNGSLELLPATREHAAIERSVIIDRILLGRAPSPS